MIHGPRGTGHGRCCVTRSVRSILRFYLPLYIAGDHHPISTIQREARLLSFHHFGARPIPRGSPPSLTTLKAGDYRVTTDEELNLLDSQLRRLKIEYEIYFSNPTKKPPSDIEWKVLGLLRKFSDGGRMNFSQRFRYNEMAQRYAIYSDLWRKKSRIREEGYRRPQDALLSIQGVRPEEEHQKPHHPVYGVSHAAAAAAAAAPASQPFTLHNVDQSEREQVERLYNVLVAAKKKAGESVSGNFDAFTMFVQKKTQEIRKQYHCENVEYSVEIAHGHVKLKAKARS